MFTFLSTLIGGGVGGVILLPLTIIVCTILIEDLTIVIVGLLAADGFIPIPVALVTLYTGIAAGDTLLYVLGRLARTHPRLARYVEHDFTAPLRFWLEHRYAFTVFSGHFVPGLRFTTYVASGFFRRPLTTYIPMAVAGGLVLLSVLFSLSYWFGSVTSKWVGPARWVIAVLFLVAIVLVGRHALLAYRAKKVAGFSQDATTRGSQGPQALS